jgi:hypothetical protein
MFCDVETDGPLSTSLVYEMDIHKEFTEQAVAQGVKLNGIAARRFPGKGLGIIAEKKLKVCKTKFYVVFTHVLSMS